MLSFTLCSDLCSPLHRLPLKSMGDPNVLWQGLSKPILVSTGQRSTRLTKIDKIDQNRHFQPRLPSKMATINSLNVSNCISAYGVHTSYLSIT